MYAVEAPTIAPANGGLLRVANVMDADVPLVTLLGVVYEADLCGPAQAVPEPGSPKVFDQTSRVSGEPFTIYRGVDTAILDQVGDDFAGRTLEAGESFAVERGVQAQVLNSADSVDLTPTAGVAVSPKEAVAILEQYAGETYMGLPTLHVNRYGTVFLPLEDAGEDGKLVTRQGSVVANGAGYGPMGLGTIGTPVLTLGTTGSAGGTFAAGTYFWVVTATNANGETVASNEVSATLALNGTQELLWGAVEGATGYNIYRGTTSGGEDTLVASQTTVNYTDTGGAGTTGSPPAEGSTHIMAGAGEFWVYATGQVNLWRGDVMLNQGYDLENNRSFTLAERTYVPTVECFVAAVLATKG